MYSLITFISAMSFVAYLLSQVGNFYNHYRSRQRAYSRAQAYLQTELCTNPRVKATLGEFNLCDQSEKIMDNPPLFTAIIDTAEDIHICGNGYCELLGHNITSSLHWIIIALAFSATMMLYCVGNGWRKDRMKYAEEYWALPGSKNKKD